MLSYGYDFGERSFSERNVIPLSFKTLKEAEDFCIEYNKQSEIYGGYYVNDVEVYKRKAAPMIVNDKFDKSISEYYETEYHEKVQNNQKELLNKLKGGSKMEFASGVHELTMK